MRHCYSNSYLRPFLYTQLVIFKPVLLTSVVIYWGLANVFFFFFVNSIFVSEDKVNIVAGPDQVLHSFMQTQ